MIVTINNINSPKTYCKKYKSLITLSYSRFNTAPVLEDFPKELSRYIL